MRRLDKNETIGKSKDFSKKNAVSKKIKTKAKYKKINNSTRRKLLELVNYQDVQLKEASKMLDINYSTAKTILRIYRLEKRIEKKSAIEEKRLRDMIGKETDNLNTKSSENKSGINLYNI